MPMLLDLILVKHVRMRRDRKRRSAAALAIYMVMYNVYRRRLCWTKPWLMNMDLGFTGTLVQEMRTGDKETVCFAGLCKRLRVFVGSHIFHNASKPVKVCHIFHANIVKLCQMYSANVSIYTSKFN